MKVSIEKQSDGSYIAYNTTGDKVQLIGTGDSVKEAKEDFFNSLDEVLQSYNEIGDDIPEFLNEEIEFRFDITSLFEYYSMFNVSALARYLGINDSLMRQYRSGAAQISDKQLEKIEAGIHRLGSELAALRLV
ncbi:pilus assembly protein HicB [uncultured Duncaniella sp.]|uniref:pilus assembly protein HicB n=1 Tax=uncultured Duncaniella sp. TaxID=2768039 RepID=UPI00272C19DA|nr:pilus assembly protein HicB [uncultured Duncaniella sp.]